MGLAAQRARDVRRPRPLGNRAAARRGVRSTDRSGESLAVPRHRAASPAATTAPPPGAWFLHAPRFSLDSLSQGRSAGEAREGRVASPFVAPLTLTTTGRKDRRRRQGGAVPTSSTTTSQNLRRLRSWSWARSTSSRGLVDAAHLIPALHPCVPVGFNEVVTGCERTTVRAARAATDLAQAPHLRHGSAALHIAGAGGHEQWRRARVSAIAFTLEVKVEGGPSPLST